MHFIYRCISVYTCLHKIPSIHLNSQRELSFRGSYRRMSHANEHVYRHVHMLICARSLCGQVDARMIYFI